MKTVLPQTFPAPIIAGHRHTRPVDTTPPGVPQWPLTSSPVPGANSIGLLWINGQDADSGIKDTQVEWSLAGSGIWHIEPLVLYALGQGVSYVIPNLSSSTSYSVRVANHNFAGILSGYSAIQTLSTLPSVSDLAPGTIALVSSNITLQSGKPFSLAVNRTGGGITSPIVEIQYAFSGSSLPSPANNVVQWPAGFNGIQPITGTAPVVSGSTTISLNIVSVRALSGNIAPSLGLSQANVTIIPLVAASIKWNPGHWAGSQNPTWGDDHKRPQQLAEHTVLQNSGPNVVGLKRFYYLPALGDVGAWDFTKIFRDLEIVRAMGKRLMIGIGSANFGNGVDYASILPPGMYSNAALGAGSKAGTYGWMTDVSGGEASIAWWRAPEMDVVISFFQAMAIAVNPANGLTLEQDPFVENICFAELSIGITGDPAFTSTSRVDQYKRLMDAMVIAFPTTIFMVNNNFAGSHAESQRLTDYCNVKGCAVGGPDTIPSALGWGQAAAIGVGESTIPTGPPYNFKPDATFAGPDLRGVVAMQSDTQGPELYQVRAGPWTPAALFDWTNNVLQQSHMVWTMLDLGATDPPIPAYPARAINTAANNPGNWNSCLQVINGNPLTHIQIPSSLINPGSSIFLPNFPFDETRGIVSGAFYVDPVAGNDANDGHKVSEGGTGPKRTINPLFASMGPDVTIYLMNGVHNVTNIQVKFVGASGTLGHPARITSLPGHTPIIDCGGGTWLELDNKDYWSVRHVKFQNYAIAIMCAQDVSCAGLDFFCLDGVTAIGGDNVGMIHVWEAARTPNISIDRYRNRLTVAPGTVHQNTSGLYFKRTSASFATLNHLEIRNFPIGIYFKHGEPVPSVNGNCTLSNSFLEGMGRNCCGYNPSGVKNTNVIFGAGAGVILSEADGGEAGDLNWYDHCTLYVSYTGTNQNGSAQPGAVNNKFTNSIIASTILQSPSTIKSDSDYNLFPASSINNYGTIQTLAQWRTANGSDAHSVQGSPVFVGGDLTTIAAYALQLGSPGKSVASDSKDMGVDITKIGVHAV